MIVAFLGHSKIIFSNKLKTILTEKLIALIEQYDDLEFYLGGYGDFDDICLSILRQLKNNYSNFKIIFITPYLSDSYSKLQNAKYLYDETIYPPIEKTPLRYAILKRNEWMIDNCDFLLCFIDREFGGAHKAFRRAINKKIPYFNLAEH